MSLSRFFTLSLFGAGLLFFACKTAPLCEVEAAPQLPEEPVEIAPTIKEPLFVIKKVSIKQAELVNTRLVLEVSIENPNPQPLLLTRLEYTFYGEGRYWAENQIKNALILPGESRQSLDLELTMNFIDMKRSLLDKVIKMAQISYRLEGKSVLRLVESEGEDFLFPFQIDGLSPVVK